MTSTKTVIGIIATLGLLLAACGDDAETAATASETSGDAAEATEEVVTAEEGEATGDAEEAGSEGAANGPSAGSAVVIVGDERFETDEVNCTEASSGTQFGSVADGPRESSQIRGLFGSTILPHLVAVTFDGGEWRALADQSLSVLEDYSFDEDAGTFEGTATFIWFDAGLEDADRTADGSFEVRCG